MIKPVGRARRVVAGILTTLAVIIAVPTVGLTAARYVPFADAPVSGDRWAFVTAFTDFAAIGYPAAVLLLIIALIVRFRIARLVLVVLVLALAALHLSWIVPRYLGQERPPSSGVRLRVLTQNLHRGEGDTAQVIAHSQQADIVVLTELTKQARDRLRQAGWRKRFPYEQGVFLTPLPTGGVRVFSRYPILSTRRVGGELNLQIWVVVVDVPELGSLHILAVHPGSPQRDGSLWLTQQEAVRAEVPTEPRSMIVGDFNAVDSQAPMRALRAAGFLSSTELTGTGWQPTYPSDSEIPPLFEIDHILLGPGLTATASTTLPTAGTDHRAVLATVAPS